jgi:hypothetical protein
MKYGWPIQGKDRYPELIEKRYAQCPDGFEQWMPYILWTVARVFIVLS